MKKIAILTTGGTIAGKITPNGYKAAVLNGNELVSNLLNLEPNLIKFAQISCIEVCKIASQDMSENLLFKLARMTQNALKDYDGIVILHGTDTLEESAYFLNLVLDTKKPVVLTGSMRPSDDPSWDGANNIIDAIITASSKNAWQKGVLVVFNGEIHSSREISKTHTTNLNAFSSLNTGKIGVVGKFNQKKEAKIYLNPLRKHTFLSEFHNIKKLSKVALIYAYQDFDLDFDLSKFDGIVVAGLGNGNLNKKLLANLKQFQNSGKIVIISSRTGSGNLTQNGENSDFIKADNLNPQKARILLACILAKTKDINLIKSYFDEY